MCVMFGDDINSISSKSFQIKDFVEKNGNVGIKDKYKKIT